MSAKAILVFCVQALFVQSALSQCTSRAAVADRAEIGYGLAAPYGWDASYGVAAPWGLNAPAWGLDGAYGLGAPCGYAGPAIDFSPTSGGALPVSSVSAVPPVGLSVASENVYEGKLAAAGEVPFVSTVGVEGVLPTAGAGAVNHHCGDGINVMVSDKTALGYAGAYGPGYDGIYDRGFAGAYAPGIAGAYDLGLSTPALGYNAGWAGKSCGCGHL